MVEQAVGSYRTRVIAALLVGTVSVTGCSLSENPQNAHIQGSSEVAPKHMSAQTIEAADTVVDDRYKHDSETGITTIGTRKQIGELATQAYAKQSSHETTLDILHDAYGTDFGLNRNFIKDPLPELANAGPENQAAYVAVQTGHFSDIKAALNQVGAMNALPAGLVVIQRYNGGDGIKTYISLGPNNKESPDGSALLAGSNGIVSIKDVASDLSGSFEVLIPSDPGSELTPANPTPSSTQSAETSPSPTASATASPSSHAQAQPKHKAPRSSYTLNATSADMRLWLRQTRRSLHGAPKYINSRLGNIGNAKPAINLDIDNTALASYYAPGKAIPATLAFALRENAKGVSIFFNTGRSSNDREQTFQQLRAAGYPVNGLCMRYADEGLLASKQRCRRQFTSEGYRILVNVGNHPTDVIGGDYEKRYLLPSRTGHHELG